MPPDPVFAGKEQHTVIILLLAVLCFIDAALATSWMNDDGKMEYMV